jgi:hypothetical protein
MVDKKHLDYFKELLEGRADISFQGYLAAHEDSLRSQFSAARFARIKFKNVDEIEKILNEEKIPYSINNEAVKYEKYLSTFHPDSLNEKGRLKEGFKETLFNGLFTKFKDSGNAAAADLYKYIGFKEGKKSKISIEKMEDIEYFAEIETRFGNKDFGLFMLRALSSIERQFSAADDIVLRAKEAVKNLDV